MAKVDERLSAEELEQLVEFCAEFEHDPVGFVWAAYPWGEGELAGKQPDEWQLNLLNDIGNGLRSADDVIQEAIASGHGIGKALDNNILVPTPNGMRKHGELQVGDYVFSVDGSVVMIKAIPYEGTRPCYKVTFDDHSSVVCAQEHLWTVRGRNARRTNGAWETIDVLEIVRRGVKRKNGIAIARQWEIPRQGAARFKRQHTPINPYLMGVLLGDGYFADGRITTSGINIVEHLTELGISYCCRVKNKNCYIISVPGIKREIEILGMASCLSHTKYIPDIYKFNDIDSRKELLRGLIDTDGEVTKKGSICYSTTSKQLADDVIWLARSLGCKATMQPTIKKPTFKTKNGEVKQGKDSYRLTITLPFDFGPPCYVQHKAERVHKVEERYLTRWIDSIEYVGERPTKCISVDRFDGLYQCGDFIVTHNSALVCFIIQWAMATREDCKGVVTANTQNQLLTKTWSELAKWHRLSICKPMFTYTATAYYSADGEHEKTWRIDALPWSKNNSEAFAGLHNQGKRILVVFDEASAIDDVIWEVVEGALTDSDTEIIWTAFGNPTKNSGRFYDCFHRYRAYWHTKQIDSRDVAVSNKKQLDKWIGQYGLDSDIIRVRVLGQFPMQGDTQLISINDVNAAVERGKTIKQEHYAGFPVVFGVDPAWTGNDLCVVYMRQGNYSKVLLDCPKNDNHVHMAGKIAMLADRYGMTHGFIDQGEGTGIYSAFKEMGLGDKWTIVPFASKPNDDYYANKRAEMWCLLKQWLKDGGAIENKEQIYNDLIAPEAFINPKSGKFQLESKADMKERGIQSPNYADALALTFAQPIKINAFSKMSNAKRAGRVRKAGSM